jgi:DNA polymerase-3 subunit epsilon
VSDYSQAAFDFPEAALPEWAKQIVVFDTETTGLDLKQARIVTACVAELDETGALASPAQEWLADPGIEIPETATNVHGITTEFARDAGRPAKEVVAEIVAALRGYQDRGIPIVAYNAPYDFTILHWEAVRHGIEPLAPTLVLDPLVIDKFADQYRKGKRRLEIVAAHYNVPLADAHNATADAVASGRVLQAVARAQSAKLNYSLMELHAKQIEWEKAQSANFAKYMRESVNPNFREDPGWPLKLGQAAETRLSR